MTTARVAEAHAHSGPGRLLSVEEALTAILATVEAPLAPERLSPLSGLGRVVAQPVTAATSLPPWDNSAMDGYAVIASDTGGASEGRPVRLLVTGDVRAGATALVHVTPGTALRIATGAPIPPGADAVVPIEQTISVGEDGEPAGLPGRDATGPLPPAIDVLAAVSVGGSIRAEGSDVRAGSVVLGPGFALTPAAVALASGAGVSTMLVHRRPVVAVLATGDEVRDAGEPLGAAGIPDANRPGLLAAVSAADGEPLDLGIARDDVDDVLGRLRGAIDQNVDAIIVSGGVSVGPYDVVKAAFDQVGRIDLWRVAVQPGKPFAFGTAPRSRGQAGDRPVLLFGLPGNPVSSLVTFELFVRPALRRLAGHSDSSLRRPIDRAVLGERVSKSHGRRAYLRVRAERITSGAVDRDERGRVPVRLAGGQGSHVLSAIAAADALAVIPEADDELPAGAEVELWWLDRA